MTEPAADLEPTHGVGPWEGEWPDDPRLDPELLRDGDRRNVVDRYRYWLHYAEGSAMPPMLLSLVFSRIRQARPVLTRCSCRLCLVSSWSVYHHVKLCGKITGIEQWRRLFCAGLAVAVVLGCC